MKSIILSILLLSGVAAAQPKDKEGFEPVDGDMMMKTGESIPASRLVGIAYGFIFAAVAVYAATVAARSKKLEDEIGVLKSKLDKRG